MVRSKIRLLSFTAFILLVVFFIFLGYFFIVKNFGIKEQIGGVFLLGVGVYVIYFYLKLTPIIEVSNSTVSVLNFFKRERYLTSEIKQVRLKQVRGYEGMVIEFSKGFYRWTFYR
ncbi:hypothetical protein DFQ07_0608 [Tenacibaculum caenipelagi]|uniref:Uncharacterized protein n=2 Tax=Tenacibaculum caenipelagi TaxID=1325435 RepID=A0A4R6TL39_9FLAO|nr:hypothetical protein DFQ07_0608 [Tenacibaculum caenipelagi]